MYANWFLCLLKVYEHGNLGVHKGALDFETVAMTSRDKVDKVKNDEIEMRDIEEDPEGCDSAEDSLLE